MKWLRHPDKVLKCVSRFRPLFGVFSRGLMVTDTAARRDTVLR